MSTELMKYSFLIFYANVYDAEWIRFCSYLKDLYRSIGQTEPKTLQSLPSETILLVFEYLDAKGLCAIATVSPMWTELSNMDTYWEHLCLHKYNISLTSFRILGNFSAKSLYAQTSVYFRDLVKENFRGFDSLPSVSSSIIFAMA